LVVVDLVVIMPDVVVEEEVLELICQVIHELQVLVLVH
jgi:hypothetical protein